MERFWKKVNKLDTTSCWDWLGSCRKGYGAFKYNKRVIGAHVMSYILTYGTFDCNLFVCHKCDNPKCVNPEHLFLGTHSDNMKDAYIKKRLIIPTKSRFKNKHNPKNKNLDDTLVKKLKSIINYRKVNKKSLDLIGLSKEFNVPYQTVRDISSNKSYKNINIEFY